MMVSPIPELYNENANYVAISEENMASVVSNVRINNQGAQARTKMGISGVKPVSFIEMRKQIAIIESDGKSYTVGCSRNIA